MIIPDVSEKHLDGLEIAVLILSKRKERTAYENEQFLRFLIEMAKRNESS